MNLTQVSRSSTLQGTWNSSCTRKTPDMQPSYKRPNAQRRTPPVWPAARLRLIRACCIAEEINLCWPRLISFPRSGSGALRVHLSRTRREAGRGTLRASSVASCVVRSVLHTSCGTLRRVMLRAFDVDVKSRVALCVPCAWQKKGRCVASDVASWHVSRVWYGGRVETACRACHVRRHAWRLSASQSGATSQNHVCVLFCTFDAYQSDEVETVSIARAGLSRVASQHESMRVTSLSRCSTIAVDRDATRDASCVPHSPRAARCAG